MGGQNWGGPNGERRMRYWRRFQWGGLCNSSWLLKYVGYLRNINRKAEIYQTIGKSMRFVFEIKTSETQRMKTLYRFGREVNLGPLWYV